LSAREIWQSLLADGTTTIEQRDKQAGVSWCKSLHLITIDVLNFRTRCQEAFSTPKVVKAT
jgi:hypothetical protein